MKDEDAPDLWSVCERKPAKHSMNRAATRWSSGFRVVPRGNPMRTGGECRTTGRRPIASWRARSASRHASHPRVEVPAYRVDPFGRRMVRRVARTGREIQEEALVGIDRAQVAEILDRALGEVFGEVVSPSCGRGGATLWLSWNSVGTNWCVSPPWNPYQRWNPRPHGHEPRSAAMCVSSSGVKCHFPTA